MRQIVIDVRNDTELISLKIEVDGAIVVDTDPETEDEMIIQIILTVRDYTDSRVTTVRPISDGVSMTETRGSIAIAILLATMSVWAAQNVR